MVARRIAASVAQRQVKYVTPVPVGAATGLLRTVYQQTADEMGLVSPPVQLHSPVPELAAAYWMLMREPMLPSNTIGRDVKEAVATAVSTANICPYCVDMHSTGMYDLTGEHDAEALVADRIEELRDGGLRSLAAWARTAAEPGRAPLPAPFDDRHRPELVGVLVAMHYLTRMVNVFLSSFLLPPRLSPEARRRFKRGVSRVLRPTLRQPRAAGLSVPLLPDAPLPPDADWARTSPTVAAAVARSAAVFDAAGARSVSPAVRQVVLDRLADWQGEETGLSRRWCDLLVADLEPADRAAGRLALLTAVASYQVDEDVVTAFRDQHSDDVALVELTAWASFAAARRVGAWHRATG
ncbi:MULTISPECIES: carboxymuconolactone decarboxylase family protein [Micromonospora]|uniref:carboxymuconolactone decarboxylase family protein n=1 Tax=Micromonospora TaxID=1873 RepID=UPI0006C532C1|nr:carboxymuconolactone decarboxylase family protein [Micromonospora sp. NRRL B-16802]KOX03250.1 carboxymuconolactone decarboxylase [Micromonospora sp. NRRL B-16802]